VAFDWIESHRGLKDHPKTVTLAATWADRKTCVIGHLQELWWWTLEYAPDGVIRPGFFPQVVLACEWHGRPEKFWSGLLESGFLEQPTGADTYVVHDWDEYAARRLAQLEKDAERKANARARRAAKSEGASGVLSPKNDAVSGVLSQKNDAVSGVATPKNEVVSGEKTPDSPAHVRKKTPDASCAPAPPTSPTGLRPVPEQPPKLPDPDADAQGPAGTASARSQSQTPPPKWEEIAPGQHRGTPNGQGEVSLLTARCPRCERSMPVAEVENHDCQLVVGEPVQAPPKRRPGGRGLHRVFGDSGVPPEVQEELSRMATHRPTPEQIAAEAARLGLMPRGDA
jgi:hypothetical protein